jgi:hypothetical protein
MKNFIRCIFITSLLLLISSGHVIAQQRKGALERLEEQKMKERAAQLIGQAELQGIYSSKLPTDLLLEMYNRKSRGNLFAFFMTKNGGWFVGGQFSGWQCQNVPAGLMDRIRSNADNQLVREIVILPNGGWIFTHGLNGFGVEYNNIPADMQQAVEKARGHGFKRSFNEIQHIYIDPEGMGWEFQHYVQYGVGLGSRKETIKIGGFKGELYKVLQSRKNYSVSFTHDGGWAVLFGNNGVIYKNIPQDAVIKLRELNQAGKRVSKIRFGTRGQWAIIAQSAWQRETYPIDEFYGENSAKVSDGISPIPARIPNTFSRPSNFSNESKSMRVRLLINRVWISSEKIPPGSAVQVRDRGTVTLGENEAKRGLHLRCPRLEPGSIALGRSVAVPTLSRSLRRFCVFLPKKQAQNAGQAKRRELYVQKEIDVNNR